MKSKGRLEELDALRGLAALAVVFFHYTTRYEELFGHEKSSYISFKYGSLGVDLFFMISGFVIFMTMLRTKSIKEFAQKRALRLYPAYLIAVILTFILVKLYGLEGREVSVFEGIFNLTMLQGFIPGIKHVDGAYWSLTIEITFYILIGCIIFFGLKKKIFAVLSTWLIVSFLIQEFYILTNGQIIFKFLLIYLISSYSHLFIAGVMFYLIREKAEIKYYLILIGCLINQYAFNDLIPSLVTTSFFFIFFLMINDKLNILKIKPLGFLGAISYSLYLIHQNLGYIAINIMERNGLVSEIYLLIPVGISIIIATFLTFYIERPIIKYYSIKMKRNVKIKEVISNI
ncbi:acyltransferase 3 [Planococcus donghaensis MPA1U2]|uniref:Acyltransferase 3 n=1 Tax=Planococcus donghaensis MPA1U2 TaxID=933115 RepID=E7RDS8_9BACL|nr:acyltransferase [Planococcus donghaensis]EGA90834.1 acyltransferase 3 [Planococcus donghaensis MPA1U2]